MSVTPIGFNQGHELKIGQIWQNSNSYFLLKERNNNLVLIEQTHKLTGAKFLGNYQINHAPWFLGNTVLYDDGDEDFVLKGSL